MAASSVSPPPGLRIQLLQGSPCQCRLLTPCCHPHRPHLAYPVKQQRLQFNKSRTVKIQMSHTRERLWEETSEVIRDFPWKKAEGVVLQKFLFLGQRVLKWSFLTVFTFSSLLDILVSFSRNKELMIPSGLFVGCMMSDFLKEVSQELFHNLEERAIKWQLLGIGCFFVLMKFVATYFVNGRPVFLLHVANGGLMQVLWLWKRSLSERERDDGVAPPGHNPSMPMDA